MLSKRVQDLRTLSYCPFLFPLCGLLVNWIADLCKYNIVFTTNNQPNWRWIIWQAGTNDSTVFHYALVVKSLVKYKNFVKSSKEVGYEGNLINCNRVYFAKEQPSCTLPNYYRFYRIARPGNICAENDNVFCSACLLVLATIHKITRVERGQKVLRDSKSYKAECIV